MNWFVGKCVVLAITAFFFARNIYVAHMHAKIEHGIDKYLTEAAISENDAELPEFHTQNYFITLLKIWNWKVESILPSNEFKMIRRYLDEV